MHISQRFIYHKCYIYHKRFIYYKDSYTKFYIRNNHQVYMASCSDPAKIGKRSLFQHKQEVYRWALWGWGILCTIPFEAEVFMYCSLNLSWWATSISLNLSWWTASISLNLFVQQTTISTWTSISWWPSINILASKGINRCVLAINTSGLTAASVSCRLRLR